MRSSNSRAPSPTPTAYSGISSYRNDSYRAQKAPAVPPLDYRLISKTHFLELQKYLASYLARSAPNARSTARQKLTRLTAQQFHELSTDVYDELVRRKSDNQVPFLPVREEFHPKRNQARQKLATLPTSRFEDLSSDVYYELARRYPEFVENGQGQGGDSSPGSNYENEFSQEEIAPPQKKSSPPQVHQRNISQQRTSEDRPSDSGYGGSRRPSEDRRRPSEDRRRPSEERRRPSEDVYRRSEETFREPPTRRPSEDAYGNTSRGSDYGSSSRRSEDTLANNNNSSGRRKPSKDSPSRRPNPSISSNDTASALGSTVASSGMIIPTKSTITEEEIKVPFGGNRSRDSDDRDFSRDSVDPRERVTERESGMAYDTDVDPETASDYPSPSPPLTGLNMLSAKLMEGQTESLGAAAFRFGSKPPPGADDEKEEAMRLEISDMKLKITGLERDVVDREKDGEARVKMMEEELAGYRKRAEEQNAATLALQRELDDLRQNRAREVERETRATRERTEEVQMLRERCSILEEQVMNQPSDGGVDQEAVQQLQTEMESVLADLDDLSSQNDQLLMAKDNDSATINELKNDLAEYKRKYEQAKTELRNVKATSQLFTQGPKMDRSSDEQLPVSSSGGILDIHITSFLTGIDALLSAGRSNAPSRVLTPMKAVVNSVSAIIDDVRAYNSNGRDMDIEALCERGEATLSNLVTASRTHATSSGMSPVSLLDAAASHVSATVTDLGKAVLVRKANRSEVEAWAVSATTPYSASAGSFSPSLRSVDEMRGNGRKTSGVNGNPNSPTTSRWRSQSDYSSSENTNSPPPTFEKSNGRSRLSDDSGVAESSEDAWAELKPYLEAQTETIVFSIQHVLSELRSANPAPSMNEHLTQVITIVSSIVAVCNDNVPAASAKEGKDLLIELGDNANRLSEIQAMGEITKEGRQIMAKSGFAVAKAMKRLMTL